MKNEVLIESLTLKEIREYLTFCTQQELLCFLSQMKVDCRKGVRDLAHSYGKQINKAAADERRIKCLLAREDDLHSKGYTYIAGLDEAGRGPLAGPVVAAAVILPKEPYLPGLNDSKKLSPQQREVLEVQIKKQALAWGIGMVGHKEIDRINILEASRKAMGLAVRQMLLKPEYLIIDAMTIPSSLPQEAIVKGDSKCAAIAAASILAKTFRDNLMLLFDRVYPQYGFKEHKGYGTARHLEMLAHFGPSPIHRQSFLKRFNTHSIYS